MLCLVCIYKQYQTLVEKFELHIEGGGGTLHQNGLYGLHSGSPGDF